MSSLSPHKFHIPVLGLCFTIDTPVKVARYGISSVLSIIDDDLLEHMRSYHALRNGKIFLPIAASEHDGRSKRITAYLDLLQDLIDEQLVSLKNEPLTKGSELWKYFELLPENAPTKLLFQSYGNTTEEAKRKNILEELKDSIVAGSIDVNIMAKVNRSRYDEQGNKLPDEFSDALSSLRGFAQSKLNSAVVISAGYNPKLYAYAAQFSDFYPDENGQLKKRIILKVSDYRSALIQGKILAQKGLWVSEFRVESGLNCGGHAFATEGLLMGPILQEFKDKRKELKHTLMEICAQALAGKGFQPLSPEPSQRVTAQGGIGNVAEQNMLLDYFELDGTGWGSPFLLVPEATNVDDDTLQQLAHAKKSDYYLSNASPLGVPFNNFRKSTSEAQRVKRIDKNRPGSPCYQEYLVSNTEFTEQPICTASRKYQFLKINELNQMDLPDDVRRKKIAAIEEKDCLCEGLTASVRLKNEMYLPHKMSAVAICPGPNLAYFSGVFSLQEMIDHIYGRSSINNQLERKHMFMNELEQYVNYFFERVLGAEEVNIKYAEKFRTHLIEGITYYHRLLPDYATLLDEYESRLTSAEIVGKSPKNEPVCI
ncbi:MAG: hypothetical protein JSS78_07875 [Bacteroidetes bacterium]|nr:hypothetical protein [Bacteroidota bacterium]